MKLVVIGSRGFNNYELLFQTLEKINESGNIELIVSGGAAGADSLAERYAKERNIPILIIKPEWELYGKSAGFVRNEKLWDAATQGIAFWDGQSKGTAHSFQIAKKQNKPLTIIRY
jgi:hypothetical protein